jgi:hypothetical protein
VKRFLVPLILCAAACSSTTDKPKAPPPASAPAVSPTPGVMSRINPNVIEESETGYVERLPKSQYVRVDDRHIKSPIVGVNLEFFKEDGEYYYVSVSKMLKEERDAIKQQKAAQPRKAPGDSTPPMKKVEPRVPLADVEDLSPPRIASPLRLIEVQSPALPQKGMWRASFAIADVNGDGIPDIVSPAPRMTDGRLRIWIGDGKGHFTEWPLTFTDNQGKPTRFAADYGGVAVGDIDGDGHADIVTASHGTGLASLFGDGKGGFTVVRTGLAAKDFSSQAVALVNSRGDGKLDVVASRDIPNQESGAPPDLMQTRVFTFLSRQKGWEFRKEGIVGGPFSNCVTGWDYDGDGRQDVLTGNHWAGETRLLWKSNGDGTFSLSSIPVVEIDSFHPATAPGTFGKERVRAFVDSYLMHTTVPEVVRAAGLSLYAFQDGQWTKHRLWRKKEPKSTIYSVAMGDLNGDGLDDVVFPDSDAHRVRILLQQPDGSFSEIDEKDEPVLDSTGQCVRLADLDGDGRLDVVVSKTVVSGNPNETGGWNVYLNKAN